MLHRLLRGVGIVLFSMDSIILASTRRRGLWMADGSKERSYVVFRRSMSRQVIVKERPRNADNFPCFLTLYTMELRSRRDERV